MVDARESATVSISAVPLGTVGGGDFEFDVVGMTAGFGPGRAIRGER